MSSSPTSDSDDSGRINLATWTTAEDEAKSDKPLQGAPKLHSKPTTSPGGWAAINTAPMQVADAEEQGDSDSDVIVVANDELGSQGPDESQASAGQVSIEITMLPLDAFGDYEDFTYLCAIVREIQGQRKGRRGIVYDVCFEDEHIEQLDSTHLSRLNGGDEAFEAWEQSSRLAEADDDFIDSQELNMSSTRPGAKRARGDEYLDHSAIDDFINDDDDNSEVSDAPPNKRLRVRLRAPQLSQDSEEDTPRSLRRRSQRLSSTRLKEGPRTRSRGTRATPDSDADELALSGTDDVGIYLQSDINPGVKSRRRHRPRQSYAGADGTLYEHNSRPLRQSGRSTRHVGDMQEIGEDNIHRSDSEPRAAAPPKAVGAKEVFKILPRTDAFRSRHRQDCDTCGQGGNFGHLIHCQGCILSYHKSCLGNRSTREHLVTKVDDGDFVLQCRRCIRGAQKRESIAPDQSRCQDCKKPGLSCRAFRQRKTTLQEQKDRETNGGTDPIYPVPPNLVNQASNVLFRCTSCFRGFHFEHLPPRTDSMNIDNDDDHTSTAASRFLEYSQDWKCLDCLQAPAKVKGVIAWKPLDEDAYNATMAVDEINEDDKAYLVRWENLSYFRAAWMPGPWVWGVSQQSGAGSMRRAFFKRDEAKFPKMRTEDAIPEECLRTDIVLDVKYSSIVTTGGQEIDKARIREVKEALIKFKGLGYEDAVWEVPPVPEDEERWADFVTAYHDWVDAKYIHVPKALPLKTRLAKARDQDFATKLEKKKQPEALVGGELMKYQLEGVNWLYYKWFSEANCVLADEMGLGKTIQIIGLLATLVSDWNCFPFLVVVPNATCANWRREIKRWAPDLRVVAYFGSAASRDMAYRYELFPHASKDLRCHIVVTSFDAAADDSSRKFFRSVPWQALIVDEGQRLKSDKTLLYSALSDLKIPFRILLTGTPLQNNVRELFNLMQFLDDKFDAAALEAEYEDLDNSKVAKLHDMIRPFFLRRTKAQVLTFLPPMAQIIVPVSMSMVQKKLYRSILAKSPELLRALFKEKRDLKATEKGALSNILMQLRKCLCHPFVYNKSIEERNVSLTTSHRNLVEASGKLQLLEVLLPKLKERGHRVLMFSQFLDMLTMVEDLLEGLGLMYHRLDGSLNSMQKQKRIDDYNATDSEYFAFLLSTRAGGVGINLATADTVIILDPDFNPHQDIQALSRAHRIGQTKKVLCFQLVTRASAEEKIMQIGRKKMALDHVLIESMDAEDASDQDLESILRHGAAELFNDDGEKDIKYDLAEVDKLLDRSQIEDTRVGEDKSAETQFSMARVWANDGFEDSLPESDVEEQQAPEVGLWEKILKERERAAAAEAAAQSAAYGRGRRAKQVVDYGSSHANNGQVPAGGEGCEGSVQDVSEHMPDDDAGLKLRKFKEDDENDTDFRASDGEGSDREDEPDPNKVGTQELATATKKAGTSKAPTRKFRRVNVTDTAVTRPSRPQQYHHLPTPSSSIDLDTNAHYMGPVADNTGGYVVQCIACNQVHIQGHCPLKRAGVEFCNLCNIAHFGHGRICPHMSSETQVRAMIAALKQSPEAGHVVKEAKKYLSGLKGALVKNKKVAEERNRRLEAEEYLHRLTGNNLPLPAPSGFLPSQRLADAPGTGSSQPAVQSLPDQAPQHAQTYGSNTGASAGRFVAYEPQHR